MGLDKTDVKLVENCFQSILSALNTVNNNVEKLLHSTQRLEQLIQHQKCSENKTT